MAKCEVCGKRVSFGKNVSFSKKATNRTFKANIHKTTIYVDGLPKKIKACTRCIRTLSKPGRVA